MNQRAIWDARRTTRRRQWCRGIGAFILTGLVLVYSQVVYDGGYNVELHISANATDFDVRITKGFGTRPYDAVRVSVISFSRDPPRKGFFDYSDRFVYKWAQFHLHSSLVSVPGGSSATFDLGESNVTIKLPKQGEGTVGLLIADPCVNSPTGRVFVACPHGEKHQTSERLPEIINTFVSEAEVDYWGILGDNFYDQSGEITADVFGRITLEAKSKLFLTLPGNHDYWAYGNPLLASVSDQCGNGHMQYYVQDTKAAERTRPGMSTAPFNFTVDPDYGRFLSWGCNLPTIDNSFWYTQIGNVGFAAQAGAYSLTESLPLAAEACAWFARQPGLDVAVLLGHWDVSGDGAAKEMAMPRFFQHARTLPGCKAFDERGMLKFIMGHTHCNNPHPYGNMGTGFRVSGFGMAGSGCIGDDSGNFGVPLFDTRHGRIRFWYFDTSTDDLYGQVIACVKTSGWESCVHLAVLWLDEPILMSPSVE